MKIHYLLLTLILNGCSIDKQAIDLADCERIYQAVEQDSQLDTPLKKAQDMQRQGKACLGTGMYDVWLAGYYQESGDYPSSVKVAQSALDKIKTEEARPNLLQLLVEAEVKEGNVDKAFKLAQAISHDYPQYSPIKYFLYGVYFNRGEFANALIEVEQVYKNDKSALSLLAMATVLHQLNRHEETVDAVYSALKEEPERIANIDGVLEAIFSLAILDRRTEAADLAQRHIAANPNWADNPTFAQAAKELKVDQ